MHCLLMSPASLASPLRLGALLTLLGLSQLHSWSSCLDDFLIQWPDFGSTDTGRESQMRATARGLSHVYQLLGSVLVVFMTLTTTQPT